MDINLRKLDFIDLISERHVLLRKIIERRWNETNSLSISTSEWYIMAKLYGQQRQLSAISKSVDISRQATHKLIKNMEAKNLVEILDTPNNKKEKSIKLTELGNHCFEQYETLKKSVEQEISLVIGESQLQLIKEALSKAWSIQ